MPCFDCFACKNFGGAGKQNRNSSRIVHGADRPLGVTPAVALQLENHVLAGIRGLEDASEGNGSAPHLPTETDRKVLSYL